jgi:hypothetical protein
MAKSIRSKWKRKMRAIKRQRYAVVERKRLEKTLGIGESTEMAEETTTSIRNDVSQEQGALKFALR